MLFSLPAPPVSMGVTEPCSHGMAVVAVVWMKTPRDPSGLGGPFKFRTPWLSLVVISKAPSPVAAQARDVRTST